MPILARDLLAYAEDLLSQAEPMPDIPKREALLRTVVTRAYYAVYHVALARAKRDGYVGPPSGYASHEGLWEWWLTEIQPNVRLADIGNRLKQDRVVADYRLRESFTLAKARRTIVDAQAAFELVAEG